MLLSCLTFLPLLFALLIWLIPKEKWIRPSALALAVIEFLLSLLIFKNFNADSPALQLVEQHQWIPSVGISYFLGIDGISLWLVILTTFLAPITILGSWTSITDQARKFYVCFFFLMTTMIGTFVAMDAILFYTFFEASLIPMFLMIGIWGGGNRIYASVKFFIFTMAGSVFMLMAIIVMMFMTQTLESGQMSASILDFYKLDLPFVAGEFLGIQSLLFFAFCLAFAIKVPIFPVHTWLPDAHVQAPTPGSVILAGVMLKMGTYGFIRFAIPMFPEATEYWSWIFLLVAVVGIIYGALVAMVQSDIKKLVAYSSVSHMGYVIFGLFALNVYGVSGGIYQMLNHGISTSALFLLVGMVYERTHSREMEHYGGLAPVAPIFSIIFIIVTMSSIAVPMTNGFIGEYLILMGGFMANKPMAIFAVLGVVLGAIYMLWVVKRVFFGTAGELIVKHGRQLEINAREMTVMTPLVVMIFWMGLYPNFFLKWTEASVNHLVQNKSNYEMTIYKARSQSSSQAQLEKNKKQVALKEGSSSTKGSDL